MAQNKYIINNGKIVHGVVEFHSTLHIQKTGPLDPVNTIGGGKFTIDEKNKTACFYGLSADYGIVLPEQFKAAFLATKSNFINKIKLYYDTYFETETPSPEKLMFKKYV